MNVSWSVESGGKKVYFAGDTGYRVVPQEAEGKDDYVEGPACVSRLQTDWRAMGRIRFGFDTYRRLYSQMDHEPHACGSRGRDEYFCGYEV